MADADGRSLTLESIFPGTSKIVGTAPGFSRTLPTPLNPIFAANEGLITNWSPSKCFIHNFECAFGAKFLVQTLNPLFPECLVLRKPKHTDFVHPRFTITAICHAQTHLFQIFNKKLSASNMIALS